MRKVLALGAHYDDVEVGVGGTLLKHVLAGDEIFVVITSSGEHRTGNIITRLGEQKESLSLIGIPDKNLLLYDENQNDFDIIGALDKLKVDVIYTMFEFDTHQSHIRCSRIGQSVGRKLEAQVIFYNSGSSYDFQPNIFSIIDFEFKKRLLNCFKSQIALNAVDIDIIRRRESFWASIITKEPCYAEGFIVRKMLYTI